MKQMADNFPKIQHYVPQFILRNFCFKNEQIHVFDKKTEKVFSTHTKEIAAEKGFYNFKIDNNKFTIDHNFTNLEINTAMIFEKIAKQESLSNITKEEKIKLSMFVAAQFARTKHVRVIAEQLNSTLTQQIEKWGIDPKNVVGINSNKSDEFERDVILYIMESVIENTSVFNSREWALFKSTEETNYCISDNPITLYNSINHKMKGNFGLAIKGIEVYFPISPKLSIGIFDNTSTEFIRGNYRLMKNMDYKKRSSHGIGEETILSIQNLIQGLEQGTIIQSKAEEVIFQNSLQIIFSTRFVYSNNPSFDLVKKLLTDNPKYKEPPQMYKNIEA